MKKFIWLILLFFGCLDLQARKQYFDNSFGGAMITVGSSNSIMYEKRNSCLLKLSLFGEIRIYKSLFLHGDLIYGLRFAEPADGGPFENSMLLFELPILLSYKYENQAFLLGPYFGAMRRQGTYEPDKDASPDFGICGGYDYYLTQRIFLGLRLNIGMYDTFKTNKNYSASVGIGFNFLK